MQRGNLNNNKRAAAPKSDMGVNRRWMGELQTNTTHTGRAPSLLAERAT